MTHAALAQRPLSLRLQALYRLRIANPTEVALTGTDWVCFRVPRAASVTYRFVFPGCSEAAVREMAQACPWLVPIGQGLEDRLPTIELWAWLCHWPVSWHEERTDGALLSAERCWRWQYNHARCQQWCDQLSATPADQPSIGLMTRWSCQEQALVIGLVDAVDALYSKPAAIPYLGDRLCQAIDDLQRQTLYPPEAKVWRLVLLNHAKSWLAAALSSWGLVAPTRL
jgi:hypothetical protein